MERTKTRAKKNIFLRLRNKHIRITTCPRTHNANKIFFDQDLNAQDRIQTFLFVVSRFKRAKPNTKYFSIVEQKLADKKFKVLNTISSTLLEHGDNIFLHDKKLKFYQKI